MAVDEPEPGPIVSWQLPLDLPCLAGVGDVVVRTSDEVPPHQQLLLERLPAEQHGGDSRLTGSNVDNELGLTEAEHVRALIMTSYYTSVHGSEG